MSKQPFDSLPRSPSARMLLGLVAAVFACLIFMLGAFAGFGVLTRPAALPPAATTVAALSAGTPTPGSTTAATPDASPSASQTPSDTPSATSTGTLPPSATFTPTPSSTPAPTNRSTPTNTQTNTSTPTPANTATNTSTPSNTPTASSTPTPQPILSGPQNVAIFNKTGNLWVTNRGNQSVVEVDGNDVGHVLLMLQNIPDPNGIAIWQAGGLAYVSNRNQGTLSEIDLIGRRVRRTIALASPGSLPWGVAVDEGSGNVYVANYSSGSVACVQRSSGLVFEAAPLPLAAHLSYNAGAAAVFAVGRQGTVLRVSCGDSSPAALFSDNSLFDVAVSSSAPAGTYTYASATDSHGLYIKGSDVNRFLALPNAPYGIEYLGRCVGAVVPAEDRLYVADTLLKGYTTLAVGHQTVGEGGQGIAYAEFRDTVYVTNYADNSLTAIAHPCGP